MEACVNYRNTGGRWPGVARGDHFAVRWTGRLRICRSGPHWVGIIFDEGGKLWPDNRYTIHNDCLHGRRNREAAKHPSSFRVASGGGVLLGSRWSMPESKQSDDGSKLWINNRYTINRWVAWLAQLRGHMTSLCWIEFCSA